MRAEIAKARYLPTPRWTAAVVVGAAAAVGLGLVLFSPTDADLYSNVPSIVLGSLYLLAASVMGAWMISLEFSAGTLQRTLTAQPSRSMVLIHKLVVVLAGTLLVGLVAVFAVVGLARYGAVRAGADLDNEQLIRSLLAILPSGLAAATLGFAAGLLTRSLGGGVILAFGVSLILDGLLGIVPGLENLTYGSFTNALTAQLTRDGVPAHSTGVAVLGTLAWLALFLLPGWVRFVRGDLK